MLSVEKKLTTNRGSITPNFLKGFLSDNLVLSNRCAAVLSVTNTGNKKGRFDSTNFSEGFPFRKFGAIAPLRFPTVRTAKGGSIAPHFLNLVLSKGCFRTVRTVGAALFSCGDEKRVV